MTFELLRIKQANTKKVKEPKTPSAEKAMNNTVKGVILNNYLRNQNKADYISLHDVQDSLLVCDSENYYSIPKTEDEKKKESSFDVKKVLLPTLAVSGVILGSCLGLTALLKKSSKAILNTRNFEQLPDLAVNMNIKEEPEFAIYRALRDPCFKNMLGVVAVFAMSGITLAAKNLIDGVKDVWVKKKSADIETELQENLIDVEKDSFSGKLNVVNDLMNKNVQTFEAILNSNETKEKPLQQEYKETNVLSQLTTSFKGSDENKNVKEEETSKKKIGKDILYPLLGLGVIATAFAAGKITLSNLKKTAEYSNNFANNLTERTINTIKNLSEKGDKKDLPSVLEYLKSISAKPSFIREVGSKFKLPESEIQGMIDAVEESTKTIFADAPVALGGIPKKIQYYCYIDEPRGHLYNWLLNPKNKFTKYIFIAFTMSSAFSYSMKQVLDGIKEVAVLKENAKTDLDLRKRLVDVEIRNFKAKKESANAPLVDNFKKQAMSGTKTKDELKQLAENILVETKNGPPYVYA